ncbi:MAG: hypothetical protein IKH34_03645 [Oscillospiraceae bacterium]|nr:hypothetical protein [Oscillospiraceae bacterium]
MEEKKMIRAGKLSSDRGEKLTLLLFALMAMALVLLASDSTSPLFATKPYRIVTADSPTFVVIGRYWLTEGAVPYRDLFDQKGPIPFLLNGLGWILTGSVHGICVIQWLALFSYLTLAYHSCRMRFSPGGALSVVLFSFVLLVLLYGLGNTVEEYNLPVMGLYYLGLLRYLRERMRNPEALHRPLWAYVYGLCMAFFLLNRASDALPVGIGVLVVAADLLLRGEKKNLGANLLAGVLGLLTLILPFVLYFSAQHALDAFWFGTIGLNLAYAAKDTAFWIGETTWKSAVKLVFYCLPILGTLAAGLLALAHRQGVRAALWLGIAIYALAFYVSSRGYPHYLITFVPLCAPACCELAELLPGRLVRSRTLKGLCAALFALTVLLGVVQERNYFSDSPFAWKEYPEEAEDALIASIPAEDRDKVLFLNCLSSLYLRSDIRPCGPYFSFQNWQGQLSESMMRRITAQFSEKEAKWVLAFGTTADPILKALDANYDRIALKGDYSLYRLRQST